MHLSQPSQQELPHTLEHLLIVLFHYTLGISILVIAKRDEELANESVGEKQHGTWSLATTGSELLKLDTVEGSVFIDAVL